MKNDPSVACILLTRDRPELAKRAVECFRAQAYASKHLIVWDNSEIHIDLIPEDNEVHLTASKYCTIGSLRNDANGCSVQDIIIHWDDDDWSHPNRIAEQVALLQSSGADCVGYRECLFWREPIPDSLPHGLAEYECECGDCVGEAWLYSNGDPRMVIGSSMCYWRSVWERHPFSETNGPNPRVRGEDQEFRKGINCVGVKAGIEEPRMICRIHAGNAQHYPVETLTHYRRAPEWDETVRRILA